MSEPQWEACKVCGGDHWTKDHPMHHEPADSPARRPAAVPSDREALWDQWTAGERLAYGCGYRDGRAAPAARPPAPDALREAAQAVVEWHDLYVEQQNDANLDALSERIDGPLRAALAAPAAPPPDLAALLHPWTCATYARPHNTDGGWLCQRAAADIAFRLRTPQETT